MNYIVADINGVPIGKLDREIDETLNDSDKTFTVPSDERWHIISIRISFIATGTVGNRRLKINIRDQSDNVLCDIRDLADVAENGAVGIEMYQGIRPVAQGGRNFLPLPKPCVLREDWDIRIFDENAVDASGDDLKVYITCFKSKVRDKG